MTHWGWAAQHACVRACVQAAGSRWAVAFFVLLAMLGGHAELAWAAGPFQQRVEVEIMSVRARGPALQRAQFAKVTLDGVTQRLDLIHGCMDLNGCPSHRVDPTTCGPGSGSDHEMFDVTGADFDGVVGTAVFAKDVAMDGAQCEADDPRIFGQVQHYHHFLFGAEELVAHENFAVELDGPAEVERCFFQEGSAGDGGMVYVVRADADQARANAMVDSDGDGFTDFEELHGYDADCDGQADILLNQPVAAGGWHDVLPDPGIPDIYVEADWMDCNLPRLGEGVKPSCDPIVDAAGNPDRRTFEPDWTAFDDVVAAFAAHQITLHIMPDEAIPVIGEFNGSSDYALPNDAHQGTQNAQFVYDTYFGDDVDRARSRWLAYKQRHVRYALFNYNPIGGIPHGYAFDIPSDMFRFAFHPDLVHPGNFWEELVTPAALKRELGHGFMHEFGHTLGLHHGGQDGAAYKPNQFSVMTYRLPRLDDAETPEYDRHFDYNAFPSVLKLCELDEGTSLLPNVPTNWMTTWTCPDYSHRGSGSIHGYKDWDCDGQVPDVHVGCLDIGDPKPCVLPGADGTMETVAAPTDVFAGARIIPGDDGVLDTVVLVDANGNSLDDLTLDGEIVAGADGRLDTWQISPKDDVVGGGIFPGRDLVCETTAVASDLQELSPGLPNCGTPQAPAACTEIVAVDEWALIQFAPQGNFSGAYQGPPLPVPVEPTPEEIEDVARQSARADVGLSSSVVVDIGNHGRQARLNYTVANFGPHSAVDPTVEVRLPEGTALVRCHVPGGVCFQHGETVVAGWNSLAANAAGSIELDLLLGCDGSGGEVEAPGRVHTTSYDPQPSNNQVSDSVVLEPEFAIGAAGNPWVKSWTNGQVMPVLESDCGPALALTCGYQAFESPHFDTNELGAGGTQLLMDIYIPPASWGGWVGELTLFFEAPGLNIWNRAQGTMALTPLAQGQWLTVAFSLDSTTQAALLGATPSARFRLASNLSACGPTVKLAKVRLGGTLTCQEPPAVLETVTSSSVLRFEAMADWPNATGTVALEGGAVSEGSHALRLGPAPWMRLESRPFLTGELEEVSNRLAMDVLVPVDPTGSAWLGGLGLLVDCPDAGLHDRWVGYHALQFLFGGEFNRLEYALPPDVVAALQTPELSCQLSFELTSNPSFGTFVLDGGGFLPEAP